MQPQAFTDYLLTDLNREAGRYLRDLSGSSVDVLIVLGSGMAER